ncbi:MAG: ubiquinol-cytochrome c reductase core subunit 1 [Bathelium mastoideum]|nr:MAG: ubiquinol-cytochrome c reductase core subunit 1 [Bathelium mastoideum]KAI9689507.1 MAG: ubiquinol-cytochrome c reductase core subunit 1 [Bathelium mastoideum]
MITSPSLGRHAQRALRCQCRHNAAQKRGLAAPASGSFQYQTGDSKGIKFASRDLAGPTTTLGLVSRAGTRYQPAPGLAEGLERFAFRTTDRRSTLRITREIELLGAEQFAEHTRESLVIGAKFLRDDLPYFVELLAEVATQTQYPGYLFHEEIEPLMEISKKKYLADTTAMAVNSAHALAYHRGLGVPVAPNSNVPLNKYADSESIEAFSREAYSKANLAIVANGAEHGELSKWVNEFFGNADVPQGTAFKSEQSKYRGGEERIAHGSAKNSVVIAFPGSSSFTGGFYKPEIAVLSTLLGGQTSIKWSPGFSLLSKATAAFPTANIHTRSAIYSDAGLLYVLITGSANDVAGAAGEAAKAIRSVAEGKIDKELLSKAKALAKFKELEHGQNIKAGIELTGAGLVQQGKPYQLDESAKAIDSVTEAQVKKTAKELLDYKASVASVGDLHVLPFAEELGLKV